LTFLYFLSCLLHPVLHALSPSSLSAVFTSCPVCHYHYRLFFLLLPCPSPSLLIALYTPVPSLFLVKVLSFPVLPFSILTGCSLHFCPVSILSECSLHSCPACPYSDWKRSTPLLPSPSLLTPILSVKSQIAGKNFFLWFNELARNSKFLHVNAVWAYSSSPESIPFLFTIGRCWKGTILYIDLILHDTWRVQNVTRTMHDVSFVRVRVLKHTCTFLLEERVLLVFKYYYIF
jgi:hypothetical protein